MIDQLSHILSALTLKSSLAFTFTLPSFETRSMERAAIFSRPSRTPFPGATVFPGLACFAKATQPAPWAIVSGPEGAGAACNSHYDATIGRRLTIGHGFSHGV